MRLNIMMGTVLVLCLSALSSAAGEKDEAKKHFNAGQKLRLMEDYDAAATEFELSVRLYPTKNALFNLANCYKAMHRYDKALEMYERLLAEFGDKLKPEMKTATNADIATLRSLLGELTIQVNVPGATIVVDGREAGKSPLTDPVILSPGEHIIDVSQEGMEPAQRKIVMVAGEKITSSFALQAVAPPVADPPIEQKEPIGPPQPAAESTPPIAQPSPLEPTTPPAGLTQQVELESGGLSVLFWIGAGSTLAVGAGGGVFWWLALKERNSFNVANEEYDPDSSSMDDWEAIDQHAKKANMYNIIALGASIGAGVLLAGTVVVLIRDIRNKPGERPDRVSVNPGGIAVRF